MSKLNSAKAVFASSKTSRRLKRSAWMLSAAVAAIVLANPAQAQIASTALPTGGNVVAGSASIGTPTPSSSLTVNQSSDRAVINWTTFDIGSAASVTFVQPSATSVAVNRVTGGGAPSEIAGQLNANGRVAILNPNGVLFAGTADVNVGSLIASTGDIDTGAFMSGGNLDITGATGGEIVVNGNINITAGNLGLAAFVAPTVRNSGVITATAGRVQLGGGTAFTLDLAGDGLLSVGVPASSALVQNNGQIFAEGGRIQMSAKSAGAAVDNLVNTGTLSVDSATLDNGTIVLEAVGGTANLSGTVAANDRNSISRNILISSDRGVNISGNLSGASGTVNITAPHIWGTGKVSTATALNLNISNSGTDTRSQGNFINDALGVIGTTGFGTTIRLGAGIYSSGVRIDASDVIIDGQGVAQIGWTPGIENAIDIWGDYVTVKNLEISGSATSGYTSFAWGSTNSRGIFVNRYADAVQLLNNNIHDIRTGIIVDGRNVNTYLLNNSIDNTKSAISIQYTDGSNVVMTDNHGSTYGNEWGINLYLNGILQADGVTILPAAGSLGANTPLAEQQRLLALRAANGGMEVQNQGYSALNRTAVYVGPAGSNSNQGSQLGKLATIQAGVNAVVTGGTVHVADGNYNLGSSQLVINHALSLIGASQAGVVIDGRAVSANGLGTISVLADNVTLSNFSLLGSQLSGGNYGIKVAPNPAGHVSTAGGTSERVSNFSVSNVTVSGSRRAELDLNGVVGATITNFTADGQGTDGAGIQITDSANVTLTGVHTLGNNWGGVALYQSNSASGYNAQTTNINIDASQNSFDEINGLFTQRDSTTQSFGQLNLAGFNYAIRNTGSRSDASQFVWFQTSLANATGFALALGAPATSSIEGYTGTAFSNNFTVVAGLGISAAVRDARAGANISVGAGTYVENVLINKAGITLTSTDGRNATTIQGVAGLGALGTVVVSGVNNVTVGGIDHGFTILGFDNGNPGIENAAVYLQGNNANTMVQGNRITANGDLGMESEYGATVTGLTVDSNIFDGKTYVGAAPSSAPSSQQFTTPNVSRQLISFGGGQGGGNTSNLIFTNNQVKGDSGLNTGATIDSVGATITGNVFGSTTGGFGAMLRVRGTNTVLSGNVFDMAGVDYTASGLYFRDAALTAGVSTFADLLAANTMIGAGAWSNSSATGYHTFSRNIQGAVNEAAPGAVVTVRPGQYLEGVSGVGYYGDAGAQQFGLYLYKDNITLRGVDAAGNTITDADDVVAFVTARYQAGFGAQNFVSGSGVTIEGLGFLPAATGDNKTIEVIGDAFTLRNSVIDNRGNETAANLYIDDFDDAGRARVESFTITGNRFYGGTYASAMVVVASGAGRTTDASNRIFSNNYLSSALTGMRGFQIQGYMPNTPWQQLYAGAVTVTGNSFDVDIPVRTVGLLSSAFAWDDVFRNNGNSFVRGGVLTYAGTSGTARATTTAGGDPDIRITSTIDASLARAQAGDTVRILDGTYVIGSQLAITTSVSLIGQSQAGTILDGRTVNNGGGLGTILVAADNTTLRNFTLLGSQLSGGNYGIKVAPNPLTYNPTTGPDQRVNNVTISDVTVRGSRRAELDINGAVGVTVTNFTADGQGTEGAGVQITDSANVTLTGVHTLGNNWGGVALYQTNRAGGYNGQTTNINIDAGQNQFEEANGLFAQLESTTQGFGQLNLTGYGYAVRNTGSRADGYQFTYFRTDLADATGWALGLGGASTSSIEGYTGTGFSNVFTVVSGLTIAAAARDVRANGTINVGAGTYASGTMLTTNGVSLLGAAGARIDASHDGDNGVTINADGVTVSGFEIFGPADQSFVSYSWPTITRGIVVANGADNVTVTGNTIHDVRNGILIDGRNANTALTGNLIDNTKSAISVQYTDGSNLNISGNGEGTFGNEWGIITYLNGIWNGATITASAGALGPNTPLSEQQRLLALAAANNGMAVYNQGYSAANRTRAYVTPTGVAGAQGSQRTLLNLQGGLNAVVSGGTVHIAGGVYNEDVSLDALRVLDISGALRLNSLTFGAGAAGTNIGTSIITSGDMRFADGMILAGDTALEAGGTLTLGSMLSPYNLSLTGASVALGQSVLGSLSVTGTDIVAGPIQTVGSQHYDGATTLNGAYFAGDYFTVSGQATLAGDTSITMTDGDVGIGSLTGAHAFAASAGTHDVVLGEASGLGSIIVSADEIVTAGASTSGSQSYTGATRLGGTYVAGGTFTVDGATTVAANTDITTGGNTRLGAVGGTGALAIDAGANDVTLGAVNGLASLSATGTTISTVGASTNGAQHYTGATTLGGTYNTFGGAFTVDGATTTASAVNLFTGGGNVAFDTIGGGAGLSIIAGSGSVALGAVTSLDTLSVSGTSIVTAGASTTGSQFYSGPTLLAGSYATNGAAFVVSGAISFGGSVSVQTAGGNAVFGTMNATGTGASLSVDTGTGTLMLGSATGLGSLTATGAAISTAGATTIGAQSYTGATTLGGSYNAGGSFTVNGATTLANDASVTSGGNVGFGAVSGPRSLAVDAAGTLTLGAVNGLTSLTATGATIATNGASTSGTQRYTGATSLNGNYDAGGAFILDGAATLAGDSAVTTSGGDVLLGAVSGTGRALRIDAGFGNATLGLVSNLASVSVTGATIATAGAATSGAQSYTGATSLAGAYAAGGDFTVNGATSLTADTHVTAGGNAGFGTIDGAHALWVDASTVTLGAVSGLTALSATGASIATSGAATSGAQSFTGATSLNGAYSSGGDFTVTGAATLDGDAIVAAGGAARLGTVGGAHALAVSGGTVTLGAVSGLTSLSASGATIVTAGASTSGAQSFTGATTLNGSYTASGFAVNGAATLGSDTSVTASGNISLGTVGGAHALAVSGNTVTLGAVNGLTALSATGASIATGGAATSGTQSYIGATSLNGAYTTGGGAFAVNGAATTVNAVSVATNGGNASFGTVGGAGGLAVNAGTGSVTLGAVSGIASLSATGTTIATAGASTAGAQNYTGATTLDGNYAASALAVSSATTLGADTHVTASGNASFGTVGGAHALTIDAGGVTLGAVSGLTSLSATGATIATAGASTSGTQSYTGATTLNGSYAAANLAVNGAATLGGSSTITTSGNASLGTVGGTGNLTINAGSASLGAVTGLGSLAVTAATIATGGAATTGAQSYTGATSLNGAYTTGGAFTVTGATSLAGTSSVTTTGGAISLGAVDAAVAGSQGLALDAGTGSVALGNLGAVRRLGATSVNAGTTVLNGASYAANSLGFTGGTGSTVRLTQASTTLNTSLPGGAGGAITIAPDLTGTVNAQQNVTFLAGNGVSVNSGDVTIGNAGSDAIRLGTMTVNGHNFTAATVKLASTFTSLLSGSQVFSANTLDTLGNVNIVAAGNESGPIRAGGSVTIDAGGSGAGSVIAGGPVNLQYDGNVSRAITSQGMVTIQSLGAIGGSVSGSTVNLQTGSGAITSIVSATGGVTLGSTSGAIGGSITAGGPVAITTTSGGVTSSITTPGTASILSQTGTVNASVTANAGVTVATGGAIGGTYTSTSAIDLTTARPIDVQVNGNVVTVTAPSGTITGVFSEIHTTNTGTLVVNDQPVIGTGTADARQIIIDTFLLPTRATVSANGEIQLPAGLALGLIAPAGNGKGGQRPPVVVNNVLRLGELLREGYTAIIIQLDESNLDVEEEVAGQ